MGYIGTSGDRDSQLVSRNVLKDFADDALTISAGSYSCIVSLIGRYNTSIAESYRHGRVPCCKRYTMESYWPKATIPL